MCGADPLKFETPNNIVVEGLCDGKLVPSQENGLFLGSESARAGRCSIAVCVASVVCMSWTEHKFAWHAQLLFARVRMVHGEAGRRVQAGVFLETSSIRRLPGSELWEKEAKGQFQINFHAQNGLAFRTQNGLAFRAQNGLAFRAQNGLAFCAQNGLAMVAPSKEMYWDTKCEPILGTECGTILGTECEPVLVTEIDTKIAPAALPIGHPLALFGSRLSQKTPRTGLVALPRRSTLVSVRRIGHAR